MELPQPIIDDLVPVVLAGGSGTRLWPESRSALPKHLVELFGATSLLQETARRVTAIAPRGRFLTVAAESQGTQVRRQLKELDPVLARHLLLEPEGRNTAAAVALATLYAEAVWGPEALLWVCASDHRMTEPEALLKAVAAGAEAARAGYLVTFGITATRPETGYGYIQAGAPLPGALGVLQVARFVEKPPRPEAERMLADGGYVWNSGMFLFQAAAMKAELEAHAPAILQAVRAAMGPVMEGGAAIDPAGFHAVPSEPIDKAVMERSARVAVVPCSPGWSDVGSWHAIWEISEKDAAGNVLVGDARVVAGRNNLVRGQGRLVTVAGLDDLAVVETADAILVARREDADSVKALVGQLTKEQRREAVLHRRQPMAWGVLTHLAERPGYALRERLIDPNTAVEIDAETATGTIWTVLGGTLQLDEEGTARSIATGESATVRPGTACRLVNPGSAPLLLVELRLG